MPTDDEKILLETIKELPIEEKIKMLSAEDKLYLAGFIDHALQCNNPQRDNQETL